MLSTYQDRDGHTRVVCDVDGRRVTALANAGATQASGQAVELAYSRVDADGSARGAPRHEWNAGSRA